MKLATLLTAATTLAAGAGTVAAQAQQQQPDATGAPLPGLNWTGVSTEGIVTVVTVVDRFLTYCAESTVFAWGPKVYSVTAPATLTITDCPCTITTTRCLSPDCYPKSPGDGQNFTPGRPPPSGAWGDGDAVLNTKGGAIVSASGKAVAANAAARCGGRGDGMLSSGLRMLVAGGGGAGVWLILSFLF